jgi:hypothetical protein
MAKLVRVQMRQPASHGDTSAVVLRRKAAGPAGNLFPVLDADLTVGPGGEGAAVLRLDGVCRPPLGAARMAEGRGRPGADRGRAG